MKRYEQLAEEFSASIRTGVLNHGDRMPSVRQTSSSRGVSAGSVALIIFGAISLRHVGLPSGFDPTCCGQALGILLNATEPEKLGIMPSFSRPRVSNDNAYAEALFRTCKYRPNYPNKPFGSIDEARKWSLEFVQWYNHKHKHSGLKFVTPVQRHDGRDAAILGHRKQVYEAAKQRRPERWSGATRDWKLNDEVWLNPERKAPEELRKAA